MNRIRILTALIFLSALVFSACCPNLAPPVRTSMHGMPGHIGGKEGEAAVSGSYYIAAIIDVAPEITLGVTDHLAIETGTSTWVLDDNHTTMGHIGMRFTPIDAQKKKSVFALDTGVGTGVGLGGMTSECGITIPDPENPPQEDETQWYEHVAYGGYADVGLGWYFRERLGPFVRARFQLTEATMIPVTAWLTVVAGGHFSLWDIVELHIAGGGYYLHNDEFYAIGPLATAGFGLKFPVK